MKKTEHHMEICKSLNALYEVKNRDYGDSFSKSYEEYGLTMVCIRLEDKLLRLKTFAKEGNVLVADETIEDTLKDLANYSIMTLMEPKAEKD